MAEAGCRGSRMELAAGSCTLRDLRHRGAAGRHLLAAHYGWRREELHLQWHARAAVHDLLRHVRPLQVVRTRDRVEPAGALGGTTRDAGAEHAAEFRVDGRYVRR